MKLPTWKPFCLLEYCQDLVMVKTSAGEQWMHRDAARIREKEWNDLTISATQLPCYCSKCIKRQDSRKRQRAREVARTICAS